MKSIRLLLLASAIAGWASLCAAGTLPLVMLPASAKWMLHLDAQALCASSAGQELFKALAQSPQETQIKAFEATFACDLRRDLVSMTVCGDGGEAQGGVIYLRGRWNLQKLQAALATNHPHASSFRSNHKIFSWKDLRSENRKEGYACLLSSNLVLLANREIALGEALDALDGKAPSLATVPSFRRMAALDTNAFLRVVAVELKQVLADLPQAAALPAAESLRLALQSQGDGMLLKGVVNTATPEAAQQLQMQLIGLQAVAMFQGGKNPEIAKLAQSARSSVNGKEVSVIVTATEATVKHLLLPPKRGAGQN